MNKRCIVGVHYERNDKGNSVIAQVKLNDGTIMDTGDAILAADRHELEGVTTGMTRGEDSHETLRSVNDGNPANNLSNLPTF